MKTLMACVSTGWLVYIVVVLLVQVGKSYPAGQTSLVSAITAVCIIILSWWIGCLTALVWKDKP